MHAGGSGIPDDSAQDGALATKSIYVHLVHVRHAAVRSDSCNKGLTRCLLQQPALLLQLPNVHGQSYGFVVLGAKLLVRVLRASKLPLLVEILGLMVQLLGLDLQLAHLLDQCLQVFKDSHRGSVH